MIRILTYTIPNHDIPTMKPNLLSTMSRASRMLLLATLALVSAGALRVQGGNFFDGAVTVGASNIDLGNTSGGNTGGHHSWAIFALSGGVTITDPVSTYLTDSNSYDVLGNVALGGSGNLTMVASWIKGGVWVTSNSQTVPTNPIAGAQFYQNPKNVDSAYLTTGVMQATAASNAATSAGSGGSITSNLTFTGLAAIPNGGSGTISLTGTASITPSVLNATYVLNVMDLILSGNAAALTLNGSDQTNYVFNINRFMTLSSAAKIVLGGGGITAANVLYNVKSYTTQYDVALSGGAEVRGIILAKDRNVKLTGASKVYGEVIARSVSLSGISKVINPFPSN